jgi:hypothetical protein
VNALCSISCYTTLAATHVILKWVQVAQPKTGWQLTMSTSAKKRSATTASMDPPSQLPLKKKKVETPLETRLKQLQEVLGPNKLPPQWKRYDPDCFMDDMRRLGAVINDLTPTTVEGYVIGGEVKSDLLVLDGQEEDLKKPVNPEPSNPDLARAFRQEMSNYVARVRTCFNGQS